MDRKRGGEECTEERIKGRKKWGKRIKAFSKIIILNLALQNNLIEEKYYKSHF